MQAYLKKLCLFSVLILLAGSCERDDELVAIVSFETFQPFQTDLGYRTGGRIVANREITINEYGVCFSTVPDPTIADLIAPGTDLETEWVLGSYSIEFNSLITPPQLVAGTTYYIRAFLTTRTGTAYGKEVEFTP